MRANEYARDKNNLRRFTAVEEIHQSARVCIRLHHTANTEQVFWSQHSNSYVVNDNPTGYWDAPDGRPCDLLSINGMGEIRWAVSSEQGNTAGDTHAADYFGLTWHGYRGSR